MKKLILILTLLSAQAKGQDKYYISYHCNDGKRISVGWNVYSNMQNNDSLRTILAKELGFDKRHVIIMSISKLTPYEYKKFAPELYKQATK